MPPATNEQIEAIRQACARSDKITVQVAKYINNVNQAQDSQFGDRLSQNADTLAIQRAKLQRKKLSVDDRSAKGAIAQKQDRLRSKLCNQHLI